VISRDEVLSHINTAIVAAVTSTIRGTQSEVIIGTEEGLKRTSAVNLDHVRTVNQSRLRTYVGSLNQDQMRSVCKALAVATGCA
jgi:mRNA-degrading endonuclease toxin of MazEF toxin-antitoxin module